MSGKLYRDDGDCVVVALIMFAIVVGLPLLAVVVIT